MPKVIPKNIADEMTRPYIDDAVDRQLKAADVPPRNKLDISFKDTGRTDDNKDYESNQDAYEENHGKLYDMTHKNTVPWKNYIVYFVLLSLLTTVFTFSKYMSGANLSGDAVVAKFGFTISGKELGKNDVKIFEGNEDNWNADDYELKDGHHVFEIEDKKVFKFTVNNYSDVTIDVIPSCASEKEDSKYSFSFFQDDKTTTSLLEYEQGSQAGKPYMRIAPVTDSENNYKDIYLLVDSTAVDTDTAENLVLDFYVEQVD